MKFCYPGFKNKACTFSFDDGVLQDIRLIGIFNKYGLKGTFNLNSGFLGEKNTLFRDNKVIAFDKVKPEDVRELYSGHEVAMHGVTHPHLGRIPPMRMYWEITEDARKLGELTGYEIKGMGYPFGTYNSFVVEALRGLGVAYARTVESTYAFDEPADYLMWHSTCRAIDDRLFECGERFLKTDKERAILYIWGHSFDFDQKDKWQETEDFCRFISGKSDIWYCTNYELAEYNMRIRRCRITETGIENPTDGEVYAVENGQRLTVEGSGSHEE